MKHQSLIHSLYKIGAVKFGEFTLKSGKTSNIYMDLRLIVSYPTILRAVADAIWACLNNPPSQLICGVPYTALPIATCISLDHNMPMIMRRKENKAHGTKQKIEGVYKKGQSCIVIEDVITSGMSIIETVTDLNEADIKVKHVGVLIDRQQGGEEALKKQHIQLHPVMTLQHILNVLSQSDLLPESEQTIVNSLINENL